MQEGSAEKPHFFSEGLTRRPKKCIVLWSTGVLILPEAGDHMKLNEAIIRCMEDICAEKGTFLCKASLGGGKSPSALYDLLKGRTRCSKVVTIQRFCEGAGIPLTRFFDSPYFETIDD